MRRALPGALAVAAMLALPAPLSDIRPDPSIPVDMSRATGGTSRSAPAAMPGKPPSLHRIAEPPARAPAIHAARGVASWFASYGSGLYAAAGPALRVGSWRGRTITVEANGRRVAVQLVDYCNCYGARLIDLSRDAFALIAPPSQGLVEVTATWATR